jgi:hypothetical protein
MSHISLNVLTSARAELSDSNLASFEFENGFQLDYQKEGELKMVKDPPSFTEGRNIEKLLRWRAMLLHHKIVQYHTRSVGQNRARNSPLTLLKL